MAGETLPPVIAVLDGDISGFLAALEEAQGELDSFAAAFGNVDFGAGLSDSTAGLGDALASDIGQQLKGSVGGQVANVGDEIAAGMSEGTAGIGDALASDIGERFTAALGDVGVQAGGDLVSGMTAGATAGASEIADEFSQRLGDTLGPQMGAVGDSAMEDLARGMQEAGHTASLGGALSAALIDSGAEAGAAAGDAVIAGMGDAALSRIGSVAAEVGESLQAPLVDAAVEAGTAAGDALATGITDVSAGIVSAAAQMSTEWQAAWRERIQETRDAFDAFVADIDEQAATAHPTIFNVPSAMEDGQEAAEAFEEGFSELITGGQLAAMTDEGVHEWMTGLEEQAAAGADVFTAEFAAALREGLPEDLSSLSDIQFGGLMYGLSESAQAAAQEFSQTFSREVSTTLASSDLMGVDLVGSGLSTMGKEMPADLTSIAGDLEGVGSEAAKTTSAFGGMASMMYGPWGMAAYGVMSLLPMMGSLLDSTSVSASTFTSAVQQDGDQLGQNTEATIQNTIAKSGLITTAQEMGLSQTQLIEAVAGDTQAQQAVSSAVDKTNKSMNDAMYGADNLTRAQSANMTATSNNVSPQEQLASAVDHMRSSVESATNSQRENTAALLAAEQATGVFNASVAAAGESIRAQFETNLINATAQMQIMTGSSGTLAAALGRSYAAFQQAGTEAGYYSDALQGASGASQDLFSAQTNVKSALDTVITDLKSAKGDLDGNTQSSIAARQASSQYASAVDQLATYTYQSEVATRGASAAYRDANGIVQEAKNSFITLAEKEGVAASTAKQVANELFQIPKTVPIDIPVTVDIGHAQAALDQLAGQLSSVSGSEQEVANLDKLGALSKRASGGPVEAGETYLVGEQGMELFTPSMSGVITPHDQISGGGGLSPVGAPAGTSPVIVNVYVSGSVTTERDLVSAIQQGVLEEAARNRNNGLAYAR